MGLIAIVVIWAIGFLPTIAILNLSIFKNSIITDVSRMHVLSLLSFLPLILGLWLVIRFWHKEPFLKTFTSAQKFRWGYFGRAAFIVALMIPVFTGIDYLIHNDTYANIKINRDLSLYWKFLLITLILAPFQAGSEELLFRGYFNRALGCYIKKPWIIFTISSAGFAALHISSFESTSLLWPYMTRLFVFGLCMSTLLYFEGGLESAISYHIINNIFGFNFIGLNGSPAADRTLFTVNSIDTVWLQTVLQPVTMVATCMIIIWANRKWGHRLSE